MRTRQVVRIIAEIQALSCFLLDLVVCSINFRARDDYFTIELG